MRLAILNLTIFKILCEIQRHLFPSVITFCAILLYFDSQVTVSAAGTTGEQRASYLALTFYIRMLYFGRYVAFQHPALLYNESAMIYEAGVETWLQCI